jgi:hypothetical protein
MQIPRLDKIVLNMGVGEAVKDTKKVKQAAEELSQIAGQKAVITQGEIDHRYLPAEGTPAGCRANKGETQRLLGRTCKRNCHSSRGAWGKGEHPYRAQGYNLSKLPQECVVV